MKTINCKVGIYDTEYTLTAHKDGSVTVRVPYIQWDNNTGVLNFRRIAIKAGKRADLVKRFFAENELVLDDEGYTFGVVLQDVLDGLVQV